MKQITFILIFLVTVASGLKSQIIPEHTYPGVSAAYVNLPVAGYKYYVMDVPNSQCKLYNNDHTLWKTINLSIPANYYLCDIQFVSENLFNTDNSIEMLYVSCIYNTSLAYYTYDTRIVSESGTILLSVPGGGYSLIYPAQTGSKLLVWEYDFSVFPEKVNTKVYSIPGQAATGINEPPAVNQFSLRNAYPNPTSSTVTIPYNLPANVNKAELKLYNLSGKLVKSFTVDRTFSNVVIQTNDLADGMYLYRIESGEFKSEAFKLSVRK
jgi:hypothetical protein